MKKSLLALAVAGAFAVPSAAMAVDVSFGGEFDLAVENFDDGTNKVNQMNNTHSRFWWDMVDDLGTGLMVKGHLELDVGANRRWLQIALLLTLLGTLVFSGYWWKAQTRQSEATHPGLETNAQHGE